MATMQQLVFTSDGDWDVMIPILDNSPVEITEYFEVRLTTDNQFVELLNNVTVVQIIDNDGASFFLCIYVACDAYVAALIQYLFWGSKPLRMLLRVI